jgi:hypothetical protein
MTLEQYVKERHVSVNEEYVRFITPNYYVANGEYNPIRGGFGCSGPNSKILVIAPKCMYTKEDLHIELYEKSKPSQRYICMKSELHTSLKRVIEQESYEGELPRNNGVKKYMTIGESEYSIWMPTWRHYQSGKLQFRMIVRRSTDELVKTNYGFSQPYFEVYNSASNGSFCLKHVYSYDTVQREQYNLKFGVSGRQIKEAIFDDANTKLTCHLFEQYR